jgi:hypothetical protein
MQWKAITSPDVVVPLNVTVVVVDAVCVSVFDAVVWFCALHAHPLVAVALLPKVITGVQVPVVPLLNFPAVAPPTRDVVEQPEIVNVVPPD